MPIPDQSPLAELFGFPLPKLLEKAVEELKVSDVTVTDFGEGNAEESGKLFSGTLTPRENSPIDLGFGRLHLPWATSAVPFRLALFDAPEGKCHLDIVADSFSLELNDLHGADFEKQTGTTPRRLIRRKQDTAVLITGEATIRLACASLSGPVVVLFVDDASARDPVSATGGVARVRCEPPHFFVGSSQFGVTIKELLCDFSRTFSPPVITELGHGEEWVGLAITEATLYTPPNALGQGGFSARHPPARQTVSGQVAGVCAGRGGGAMGSNPP